MKLRGKERKNKTKLYQSESSHLSQFPMVELHQSYDQIAIAEDVRQCNTQLFSCTSHVPKVGTAFARETEIRLINVNFF